MNKVIVIINGSGGVGKDTFVNFCKLLVTVNNISSVDKIKEAAKILGWNGSKDECDRKFLSDLKLLSSQYNNSPYNYIKICIENFRKHSKSNIMFIHVREPEEIEKLKNDFGCITLLITNINKEPILSNVADAYVDNYKYDYIIHNDSDLKSLLDSSIHFVRDIIKD